MKPAAGNAFSINKYKLLQIINYLKLRKFKNPVFIILALVIISTKFLYAQHDIPIGTWRTHLSYQNLDKLIIIKNKVYAAGNYSFMNFDKDDNSINMLSKINGFSDVDISAMAYDEESNIMIIGYASGAIDLLKNEIIVSNHEIKNAPIAGSKKINHITFNGPTAFLSTDFGIVVFNINTINIKEIYSNLGLGGTPLSAYSSIIFSDSIFLATNIGILAGSLNENINLMDHLNWRRFSEDDGLAEGFIGHLEVFNNELYAGIDLRGLYVYDQNSWTPTSFMATSRFNDIRASHGQLLISLESELYISNIKDHYTRINDILITEPGGAAFDSDGKLWIADQLNGLISDQEGSFRSYSPGGPLRNDIRKINYVNHKIISLSGGYSASIETLQKEGSFSIFDKGNWINYATSIGNVPAVQDLVDVAYHNPTEKLYFASFGDGILEWDQNDQFVIINEETTGATIQSTGGPSSTLITGIKSDAQDKLWITNYGVASSLHSFETTSGWNKYSFGYTNSQYPLGITISSNGDKWVKLRTESGSQILVFNEANNTQRLLNTLPNEGSIPGERVNEIVQDLEGFIWIGTNKGISYFVNTFSILNNEPVNAIVPRWEEGFLLRGENVTAIKVDGGNRKWIGTTRGLWLFEDTGESLVQNYNKGNSPLPSNHIMDIEIDERSGEVFIATNKGLISFRGTATDATKVHQNVKIFPNPVRSNFTGQLGISGLTENAIVKITDIGGRLVRQLFAEGGTAVWDINDNKGSRVSSGIYLVLSSSADGVETFMGKIAVIE